MFWLMFVLLFVVLVVLELYFRYCRWGRLMAKIPGNWEIPFLGHALDLASMNAETSIVKLRRWAKTYKRIYKMRWYGIGAVNILHPDDVEVLYSSTTYNFKKIPYNFLRPWLREGLLVSNGDKWRHRRKLLTPAFHFNILKRFCSTFNEYTERLLKNVEAQMAQEQERTDIVPLMSWTTLCIMCDTSMGISLKGGQLSDTKEYSNNIHKYGNILRTRYFNVWYVMDWLYNFSLLSWKERTVLKNLHNLTLRIIKERKIYRANNSVANFDDDNEVYIGKARMAMLDLLLESERDGQIDMKGIREEVDTFLFEGHDTTATALSFMIMRIANEPEIQDKIYEEQYKIFGGSQRPPSMSDLMEMKYLECCIKESLRIYPSVHFMARYLTEDVVLGDYTVPGGTIIHVHVYDIHHNPEWFPEPEKFNPERFLRENTVRTPLRLHPLQCWTEELHWLVDRLQSQKFAMLEMKTVMSGLLRRFRLEAVTKTEEVVLEANFVLRAKDPLYVRFKTRKSE